jgi:hydrogenase maturation protein HypF
MADCCGQRGKFGWKFGGKRASAAVNRKKYAKIAIGGGCAMNAILMTALRRQLETAGFIVLEALQAPPNDGGLALGQAWVARQSV